MTDDLIRRQDAIEAIFKEANSDGAFGYIDAEDAEKVLNALPSAERKKGKWIWRGEQGDSRFMCSVCKSKENVPTIMGKPTVWEYCPNCGAEMRGEQE